MQVQTRSRGLTAERLLFSFTVVATLLALSFGCLHELQPKTWTPYERPEFDPQVDVIDGKPLSLRDQTAAIVQQRNSGCVAGGCHENATDPHQDTSMNRACVDCHGGNGRATTIEAAHPKPNHAEHWPSSANPKRSYTLLNEENWEWIRFVNPGDLRVANTTCGPCHETEVLHTSKSLMTTSAHFFGVAAYANGIVSTKRTAFGESYSPEGIAQRVNAVPPPTAEEMEEKSQVPFLLPLPNFEISQTGNVFRSFEKGSRLGTASLAFNGLPVPLIGLPDKLEDPGRPNNRLSDRDFGTLNRVDLPLLNVHKTRLNDPLMSFLGTNDHPGDYRSSGCTACHMVYANDRSPVASGPYAKYGNNGTAANNPDPTIPRDEPGHPIEHKFTIGIPSSQCMVCHHHQPNSFVNPYLGFTMWTYETDGEALWPEKQKYPTNHEAWEAREHNPERAAVRGKWGDVDVLPDTAPQLNPNLKDTQFADYHGHGWMFRGAFKMDRNGNFLDKDGSPVNYDDPTKFSGTYPLAMDEKSPEAVSRETPLSELVERFSPKPGKAVHLKDIHAELGMHCVDCHFWQDVHGDGRLYAEYQAAIEIRCQDCHGTATEYAKLETTGPAARPDGIAHNLKNLYVAGRTKTRFVDDGNGVIKQRSMLYDDVEWTIAQVRDTARDPQKNEKATYAHTVRRDGSWGASASKEPFAHDPDRLECYACHSSWITSCWGCHLPQEANWRTNQNHFIGVTLRNYATYNPQVARDSEFLLGVSPNVKGNTIAPVRSSSAVTISSKDGQRRQIYPQIGSTATNGMSGQCFNTHFPHTVRKTETRACSDCHVSDAKDNNAYLAQTYLLGTNTVNLLGYHAYVGVEGGGFYAVRVTAWDEPQAVIGSHLHRMVYPDDYQKHIENGRQLKVAQYQTGSGIRSLGLKGEYLYAAGSKSGFWAYDVAQVCNKDFSDKLVTAPVSPLGQDTHNDTKFATAIALPFNNYISMSRLYRPENKETPYPYKGKIQNMHELYRYVYISDREEGLVIVDANCLTDGNPQNNFTKKALSFNPEGALNGAENLTVAGTTVYICCDRGIVAVDIDDPLEPRIIAEITSGILKPTSIVVQFRYAFVTDGEGVKVLDITLPQAMKLVPGASVPVADARNIYIAKTYGYVAAGRDGLIILDLTRPEVPRVHLRWSADGVVNDLYMVKVASTNDSVYAYLADGQNGLRIAQLITPTDGGRSAYGFSADPRPELIAQFQTRKPAICVQKGLDRDRAVDESGNQVAVFGRIGGRPMNLAEMRKLYLKDDQHVYTVSDVPKQPAITVEK